MGGHIEHAGRTIRVRMERAASDVSNPFARPKMMLALHVITPHGDVQVALPPDKAEELADLIKCVLNERLVKSVMRE